MISRKHLSINIGLLSWIGSVGVGGFFVFDEDLILLPGSRTFDVIVGWRRWGNIVEETCFSGLKKGVFLSTMTNRSCSSHHYIFVPKLPKCNQKVAPNSWN